MKRRRKTAKSSPGAVRIIGGEWRSRRVPVIDAQTLRPSSDRARETLFNWLSPVLPGSRCLDLYAGSGVLALEAVSRGADSATLVDIDPAVCRQLTNNREMFDPQRLSVLCVDALRWLDTGEDDPYDVVFLDPPFGSDLLDATLARLTSRWLTRGALVYLESNAPLEALELPGQWAWQRRSRIGKVNIALVEAPRAEP